MKNYKISEKLKGNTHFKGKHHTEESRKQISETIKKRWQDKEYREKQMNSKPNQIKKIKETLSKPEIKRKMSNAKIGVIPWNKGKKDIYSKETIEQISQSVKNVWENDKEYRDHNLKTLNIARKKNRQISSIEKIIAKKLEKENIYFGQQVNLLDRFKVDFLIEDFLIVEADGDYWHNLEFVKEKDKIRDKMLTEAGFIVLRFWEHDIKNNVQECIEKVKGYLI